MTEPVYTTLEAVVRSPDIRPTAAEAADVWRHIQAGARMVDVLCLRKFYPWTGTRYFNWPNRRAGTSWRLWLDQHELAQLDTLVSGGVTITDYFLEPVNSGPPYNRIEIDRGGSGSFVAGDSEQRSIAATGTYAGCPLAEASAGALSGGINSSVTTMVATVPAGIGDLLRIDSERLLVTDKQWLTSGQTGSLTESLADNQLTVASTAGFAAGEDLLLDAEIVTVVAVAGTTLVVKRAQAGTTLAAHTGATVYWPRTLVVERAAAGTTAAAHSDAAAIARHLPPGPVEELNRAYALDLLFQSGAGWARTIGSGEGERAASGRGIKDLEQRLVSGGYARRGRIRSV